MSPTVPWERLRSATEEALDGYARARAENERRDGEPPRPGDVFALAETAELAVMWAVIDQDPEDRKRLLAVPLDLNPLVGSADVEVPAEANLGTASLRCEHAVWLEPTAFAEAKRAGFLEPHILARARRKRAGIETGDLRGSALEQEIDSELEYQDWSAELARAQAALCSARELREPEELVPAVALRPRTGWGSSGTLLKIAASILVAASGGGLLWQQLRIAELERLVQSPKPQESMLNPAVRWLYPREDARGEPEVVGVPAAASHFVLVLRLSEPGHYSEYQLEVLEQHTNREVWSHRGLTEARSEVSVALAHHLLPAGEYRLDLYGLRGAQEELVAQYALHVIEE